MSFSTDWDVDHYRADYESEEHWELRKAFIEAHKDKFPEDEIVCLAQVFTNIEFLGCRYPYKTMERVALLSKEIAAKFRESRSGRLKRTFVGASDAASAKAKGRGPKSNNQITSKKGAFPLLKSSFIKQTSTDDENTTTKTENTTTTTSTASTSATSATADSSTEQKMSFKSESDSDDGEMVRPSFASSSSVSEQNSGNTQQEPQITVQTKRIHLKRVPNTGFILYETLSQNGQEQQSANILRMSAAKQGATIKFDFEVSNNTLKCVVRINDTIYGSALVTASKKEAKKQSFDNALEYARRIHYTIKQRSVNTMRVDVEQDGSSSGTKQANTQGAQLDADNKGFKMMKMLGWSGGALGVSGNGIEQPISIEMKVDRKGLGLTGDSTKLNSEFFFDYLTKYKIDESATHDLVFSKDFTKDERKILHEIANRLQLRSRSHNAPDGTRHLVIAKTLELTDLANDILNDGLRSKSYELIAPTHPLPELPQMIKKSLSPHLAQRKANKIGFNYKQQNSKPNLKSKSNSNQNPHGRFKPKQRKFF